MATAAAQREDLATIGSTLKVMIRVGQPHQDVESSHLCEQELVHAAALLRPVTQKKESVHLGRVINAIALLVQDAPEPVRAHVKAAGRRPGTTQRYQRALDQREEAVEDPAFAHPWRRAAVRTAHPPRRHPAALPRAHPRTAVIARDSTGLLTGADERIDHYPGLAS